MLRRSVSAALVLLASLLLGGAARATPPPALTLTEVASGLSEPIDIASTTADPTALYVVEKGGTVERVVAGVTDPLPFFDISKRVSTLDERGLLSMTFSPTYRSDHLFYVDYTAKNGAVTVAQYRVDPGKAPKQTKTLLKVSHGRTATHNGGQLAFGPDGMLYVSLGDGGCCGDPENAGQNPKPRLAKLLRASAPKFNPWEIAGYGLRNPWRLSFDSATGDLYIGDVGQDSWEEIDYRASADVATPANYGWSRYEGAHDYNSAVALNPPDPPVPLVDPAYEYPHGPDCAVIGGYVYHGSAAPLMPNETGRYFFTDNCTGAIRSLVVAGGIATDERDETVAAISIPSSFGLDASGELYVASLADGKVYRLSE